MLKGVLIILACSLIHFSDYAQKKNKANLEVFDEMVAKGLDKFIYYPGLNRNNNFIFIIKSDSKGGKNNKLDEDKVRYITGIVKKKSTEEKLKYSLLDDENKIPQDSNYNIFILNIIRLKTVYNGFAKNKFLGEKTINRQIELNIGVAISADNNLFKLNDSIVDTYHDVINMDDYESVESSQYLFLHADPPEIGQFESIIFPILLITFSAAATVLFFIIRTK